MDTQITVGGYRQDNSTDVDHWGYADGPAVDANQVAATVHDGSLGDAAFVYQGVEYTVKRLTISSNTDFEIEIEDADAAALPATAAVGIELQGSPTGGTVLFDWRQRAEDDVDDEVKTLLTAWRNAPGTVLPVRILNLDASDVWSADLHYGTLTSLTVGYGAPATGTLTATGFVLNGVEYTVDRLTVTTNTSAVAVVRFATTPDLPATAQLRLAVPRILYNPGLNRYLALEPASRVSGGTDVDYEWPWPGVSGPAVLADNTNTFYLTRAPGRTGDVSGFWEATLTPNGRGSGAELVGYRGAGLSITDFTWEDAGAGTLAPGTMSLGGVTYTVEVLAIVSNAVDWRHVSLRTDPLLPRGQDLWLELEHVDGSTAVFAIDTATVEAPGYRWRDAYAGEDRHGWGTDGSDADTAIDSVTVRLSTGAPTITGTAQVGETLTAVTTGITDADGLTSATYTYQWIQVNGTAADIAAANSSTYTLVDADLGKAIKVKVSFTDDASNAETRTSAATAAVTAAPTTVPAVLVSNVGQETVDGPFISGTEAAQSFTTGGNPTGYTLTSIELRLPTIEDPDDPPAVKLFRGSANGTEVATFTGPAMLDANTEKNYAFTPSTTVNLFARTTYWVVIVGDGNWSVTPFATSVDATSAPGWRIGERADRPVGSTGGFTASQVSKFQIRVNGTVGITPVTNAAAMGAPTITGTAQVGQTLTAVTTGITDADGLTSVTYTYQWIRVDGGTEADIASANSSTYVLDAADQGKTIKVKVSFTDDLNGEEERTSAAYPSSGTVTAASTTNTAATGAPTITGTAQVGKRLTAVTTGIDDDDGLTNVGYTYQWIRVDGGTETDITGANSSTYTLRFADQGKTIKVRVSFTDDGSNAETLTSAATATVTPVTPTLQLGFGITDGASLVAPGSALAGKFLLFVTFPGFTTVTGMDTDDVEVLIGGVVSSGAVLSVAPFGANGRKVVVQVDASTGGQAVTFRVKENAIAEGNAPATLDREWTTESDPLTAAWSSTATAPVRSAFNVILTFSHEVNRHNDQNEAVPYSSFDAEGDAENRADDLSIVNGSITFKNLSPRNTFLSTTFTGRTTPRGDFEGLLRLTLEAGAVGKPGEDSNSNNEAVFEILVDTKKPAPVSGTIDGTALTLTFSEALDETSVPAAGDFSVSVAGATATAPASLSLSGDTMTFALATAVTSGQTVTIAYTKPASDPIKDPAGNEADSFTAIEVTNNTGSVVDDDLPQVSIAAPTGATDDFLYEFEAATDELQYQWVLTRAGLTDAALTVDMSVAETGGGDFAADGADTVTFDANKATTTYTPITADDLDEGHGTVTVTVTDGTDYDVDPDAASAALAVRDDDGELVTVTLDPATLKVKEGRQAQLYAAAETEEGAFDDATDMTRLFGATVTQASVEASTEASTGTGAATAGTDYTALAAETVALPFADFEPGSGGVLQLRVVLPAIATEADEVDDPDETFKVKLAAPADQDARIAVSTTAATVTISEGPPDGAIRLCSGIAASTCTDVEKTLAARNTEGRVEVIYNDEWGTVCDDYWSNGDGNVACRQMGFAAAERVFWNSHFGGAARGTKIWLDNLQCVGDEDDLLECRRRGSPAVGEHNCSDRRHTEDAGVRCLATETAAHGAKLDPATLTIAPGGTARYWLSLTKPLFSTEVEGAQTTYVPHSVSVKPTPDAGLSVSAPGEEAGYLGFATLGEPSTTGTGGFYGWSYGQHVDVSVPAGTRPGEYKVAHTMRPPLANPDFSVKLPALTVTVTAAASSGPAPVSATVSGRDASVRFDAPLDASFAPSAADFAVLADGRRLAVTGAWTAGRALLLELAEPATGAVRLAYVPSAAAPLGGRDGSPVSPFETLALARPRGRVESFAGAKLLRRKLPGAPGELADDAPDALTPDVPGLSAMDAAPKLEGAPGLEAALADALRDAPGPVAATLAAPRRAVADLSGLGAVPELRRVNLAGNAVTDAGPLALLADLERLDLSDNAVADLWPLSGLAELRVLDLSGNRVTDVTALAGLPRLRVLELSGNAVVDLSPLGALPNLEYLGVAGNRVTDVTALANLHALTRLDLDGNAVVDAAPLGDAARLVWLRLSGNRLTTLDGLGRLTQLRWVWVADNPLPDGAVVTWPERAWVDER